MSKYLRDMRNKVRWWLNDRNPGDYIIASDRVDAAINSSLQQMAAECDMGQKSAAITMVDDQRDYELNNDLVYAYVHQVILDYNKYVLERLSFKKLNEISFARPSRKGWPVAFAQYEDEDTTLTGSDTGRTLTIRMFPAPTGVFVGTDATVWYSQVPETLDAETDYLHASPIFISGLEKHAASRLLASLPQVLCDKLGVDKSVGALWSQDAETLARQERIRMNRLKRGERYMLERTI